MCLRAKRGLRQFGESGLTWGGPWPLGTGQTECGGLENAFKIILNVIDNFLRKIAFKISIQQHLHCKQKLESMVQNGNLI